MSEYTQTLSALREVRAARDAAAAALYSLQLRHHDLQKKQRKAANGELVRNDAQQNTLTAISQELEQLKQQLAEVKAALRAIEEQRAELKRLSLLIEKLRNELETAQQHITEIEQLLLDESLNSIKRKRLEEEQERLRQQMSAVKKALPESEAALLRLAAVVEQQANNAERLAAQQRELESALAGKQKELDTAATQTSAVPNHREEIGRIQQELKTARGALNEQEQVVKGALNKLFIQLSPQQLIEEWNDALPILLLPVRLETRFKGNELWVRIFPDEIAVNTHEKTLTVREVEAGQAYWTALFTATSETQKKEAWRILADVFGSNRSAWVALMTKPENWNAQPLPASADELSFPAQPVTKPDSWSQAPHSRVMPDRFVLMTYRNGVQVHTKTGKQLTDNVVLGPSPLGDDEQPTITRDAENRLNFGDDFKWVTDFETAVHQGLGFKLPVTAQDLAQGFDQLLVIGLKHSADELDAKHLLEELFNNHHYSKKGLSLVPQGAATNNTDGDDSGFDSSDFLHDQGYFIETGAPLFTAETNPLAVSDGQRLCDYLGIDYTTFQYVSNSGSRDTAQALAMNRALYAGTLGYYTNSMLNEVLSPAQADQLRQLFCNHVTGRGPLPALRVGKQPYGVLLTSDFEKWSYPRTKSGPSQAFEQQALQVMKAFGQRWKMRVPDLAHISKSGDPGANLMNVLGLQPTSAEYYQRVGYSFDYLNSMADFAYEGEFLKKAIVRAIEQSITLNFLRGQGYSETRTNGTEKPVPHLLQLIFRHYHTQLASNNLIDNHPFSETELITPYDTARNVNYIDWLIENAGDTDKLEKRNFGTRTSPPNTLLFMLLHHALLHEAKYSIHRLLEKHNIGADELIRSRTFMNMSAVPDLSPWEVFRAPANQVISGINSSKPLLEYVREPQFTTGIDFQIAQSFTETLEAMQVLRAMPTAKLERALAEHIDTLTYRLDAWQTALLDKRIRQRFASKRESDSDLRSGSYIGAFGYLEKVKPDRSSRLNVDERELPQELRENKNNLYRVKNGGGYVHTPSINHAAAAAILRNGYLTHATPAEREKLSVNLSSERVRRAMLLIDGIRNGQTLEALLGYQFERGMHDWTTRPVNPVFLNQFKPDLRKAFPITRTKLPRKGITGEAVETINDYQVINGLAIANAADTFPLGIPDLPALTAEQTAALKKEKDNLENSLDAMRDLLLSESAYQLALGNFDRAAAVMQAVSGGNMPPEIEVIHSARGTDLAFTHRVVIQFDPLLSANPWPGVPLTLRAATEPGLNHWAASLLGDPTAIRCTVRAVDAAGATMLDEALMPLEQVIALSDLHIQAIDLVQLISSRTEQAGNSELESRIRFAFARLRSIGEEVVTEIAFANSGSNAAAIRSFAEVLPLADYIRQVISKARPVHARDYATASKVVAELPDNPNNTDSEELNTRVEGLLPQVENYVTQLEAALLIADSLKTASTLDAVRDALVAIADAGLVHAWPRSSYGYSEALHNELREQAESVKKRFVALKAAFTATASKAATSGSPTERCQLLVEMAQLFLGADFRIMPRFRLWNNEDAAQADASREQLLKYAQTVKNIPLPADEWLHGAALVRPAMHTFQLLNTISENLNGPGLSFSPMQLPWRENDNWLGCEFPAGTAIVHDTLSMVQLLPQGFSPAGTLCGLLIDEWTESIPHQEEMTGISFHFNQPDSAPPQALLLTLSPELTGHWKWDNLTSSVLDTFARARERAVEPDELEKIAGISTLLPAILSEFSTGKSTISLDLALNLELFQDFYQATAIITPQS